jgi:hypothetical protein
MPASGNKEDAYNARFDLNIHDATVGRLLAIIARVCVDH